MIPYTVGVIVCIKIVNLKTTIAEKLDAILNLMEFSTRMKDYYDIHYLAHKFDFSGESLSLALKKTFENRGHVYTAGQFERVMAFSADEAMQKKWTAFCRKIDVAADDFRTVLRAIATFLSLPYQASLENRPFPSRWSASTCSWHGAEE